MKNGEAILGAFNLCHSAVFVLHIPTDHFTLLELQNQLYNVPELFEIRHLLITRF